MADKAKHHFKKAHHMPPRGAPMTADAAANTAGDPAGGAPMPQQAAAPMPAQMPAAPVAAGPPPGAVPGQAKGGSVDKVVPMSRMQKMYAPKRVRRA